MAIVARLLRGEPLELVARETNVSIGRLSEWRERALAGAATAGATFPYPVSLTEHCGHGWTCSLPRPVAIGPTAVMGCLKLLQRK